MCQQLSDPFLWKKEKWVYLLADDVYSLFDPEQYGLTPTAPHTACWKGFVIQFRVTKKQLYLDRLQVCCANNDYPPINGIHAVKGEDSMYIYNDLDTKLSYSGVIIIGKDIKSEYKGRYGTWPHFFAATYNLTFSDGRLVKVKNTSGQYFGI